MPLPHFLCLVLNANGYFCTGALASEALRYGIAIAAFAVGIVPAIVYDRRMKRTGALTFTIVRLF